MSRVSSSHDKRILVHLALAADQEEDIEEMEAEVVEDTEVDHHQDLVVDTVEGRVLEDQEVATEVVHHQVLEDTMARAEKVVHHQEDTHLLVVMTTEAEDTEEVRHQVLVVDIRVETVEDLDTVVLRVEATEVTHSVIADHLLDTASHDHLSLGETHLTMHTLSEVNSLFIPKKNPSRIFGTDSFCCYLITHSVLNIAEKCAVSGLSSSACMSFHTFSGSVSFLLSM